MDETMVIRLTQLEEEKLMEIGQGYLVTGVWLIVMIVALVVMWKGERNER
jgi:hypothetical protein